MKSRLGGNVMLGLSMALSRALAFEQREQVWKVLRREFFADTLSLGDREETPPRIFANMVNGGAHAPNNLTLQEYLVVTPSQRPVVDTVYRLRDIYRMLRTELQRQTGVEALPIGDEGGFAVSFPEAFEPLGLLADTIGSTEDTHEFGLALDAAANEFFERGRYRFDGEVLTTPVLRDIYREYIDELPALMSIEDPFEEEDEDGFRALLDSAGHTVWIVGDDITATDPERIREAHESRCINAVIIKPNQIGTVSETCTAMNAAARRDMARIVSHRSGETGDNWIMQLAKAGGAEGVKIGAPVHERILKYNELIRLYDSPEEASSG